MKRLTMVAAASFLAAFLIGCGEGSKPAATKPAADAQQEQGNAAQGNATQNTDNNANGEQKPAEGQTQGN